MGCRVSSDLSDFLQTDPIAGGSCNAYDYACQDPINRFDLSGLCWSGFGWACDAWHGIKKAAKFITDNKYMKMAFAFCGYIPGEVASACGAIQAAAFLVQGRFREAGAATISAALGKLGDRGVEALKRAGLLEGIEKGTLDEKQLLRVAKGIISANAGTAGWATGSLVADDPAPFGDW